MESTVQDGDVGQTLEHLRAGANEVEVEQVEEVIRVIAADRAQHDSSLGIGERGVQVIGSLTRRPGRPVPHCQRIWHHLEPQPERFEIGATAADAMRERSCAEPRRADQRDRVAGPDARRQRQLFHVTLSRLGLQHPDDVRLAVEHICDGTDT